MPPDAGFAPVSVIVPAFRAASTVGRALVSIAAQTAKPEEVLVVDDGSNDGTFEAAREMSRRMEGVELVVIRQANAGAGVARNRAIAEARQPILAFLDADDEWLPEKLERSIAELEKDGRVLVAHNYIRAGDRDETVVDCVRNFAAGDPFVSLYRRGYIATSTVVARKETVDAVGGFDTGLATGQDFDLWLKMLAPPGTPFAVFPEALTRYHISPSGITANTARRLACCLDIADRHARALAGRPGGVWPSVCFRTTAVHYEAIRAYGRTGAWGKALKTVAEAPLALAATVGRLRGR